LRLLIDTQAFLWWVMQDPQLSTVGAQLISEPANEIVVSAVVPWEIAIKWKLGKLILPAQPSIYVPDRMRAFGFVPLDITMEHALRVESLPLLHRDPFDRLLVAQSLTE
jgi:PIN domain nuclease of toxin-antitoxin system